ISVNNNIQSFIRNLSNSTKSVEILDENLKQQFVIEKENKKKNNSTKNLSTEVCKSLQDASLMKFDSQISCSAFGAVFDEKKKKVEELTTEFGKLGHKKFDNLAHNNEKMTNMVKANRLKEASIFFIELSKRNIDLDEKVLEYFFRTILKNRSLTDLYSLGFVPNVKIFTFLIKLHSLDKRYLYGDKGRKAEFYYKELIGTGLKPNVEIYSHLITAFHLLKDFPKINYYHDKMVKDNLDPDIAIFEVMIYQNRANITEVEKLFKKLKDLNLEPSLNIYTSLITAYGLRKDLNTANLFYEELKTKKQKFNLQSADYTKIFLTFSKDLKYFEPILKDYDESGLALDENLRKLILKSLPKSGIEDWEILKKKFSKGIDPPISLHSSEISDEKNLDLIRENIAEKCATVRNVASSAVDTKISDEKTKVVLSPSVITAKKNVSGKIQSALVTSFQKLIAPPNQLDAKEHEIHLQDLISRGEVPDRLTVKHLLTVYRRQRNTIKIQNLYDTLISLNQKPNPFFYHSLMFVFSQSKNRQDLGKVEHYFYEMLSTGVKPRHVTFKIISNAFQNKPLKLSELYTEIIRQDLPKEDYNKILNSGTWKSKYFDFEVFYKALTTKNKNFVPDIETYNILLDRFSKQRLEEKFLFYFEELFARDDLMPNKDTLCHLKWMFNNNLDKFKFYLSYFKKCELSTQDINFALVYSKNEIDLMDAIYEKFVLEFKCCTPDVLTITYLMRSHGRFESKAASTFYYNELLRFKIKPNSFFYLTVMQGYNSYTKYKSPTLVEHYFNLMIADKISPTINHFAVLLSALKSDDNKVYHYYKKMLEDYPKLQPNNHIFQILIDSAKKNQNNLKSKYIFDEMISQGLKPNAHILNSLYFENFDYSGDLEEKLWDILNRFKHSNVQPDKRTWTEIIKVLTVAGDYKNAYRIFQALSGTLYKHETPPNLLFEVKYDPTALNSALFCVILDTCKLGNMEKEFNKIWKFCLKSNYQLNSNVLTSYIEGLVKFKRFKDAIETILEYSKVENVSLHVIGRRVKPDMGSKVGE
ncbi:hypothetical protein HK099_003366, partial [Clydaea vesicula]